MPPKLSQKALSVSCILQSQQASSQLQWICSRLCRACRLQMSSPCLCQVLRPLFVPDISVNAQPEKSAAAVPALDGDSIKRPKQSIGVTIAPSLIIVVTSNLCETLLQRWFVSPVCKTCPLPECTKRKATHQTQTNSARRQPRQVNDRTCCGMLLYVLRLCMQMMGRLT